MAKAAGIAIVQNCCPHLIEIVAAVGFGAVAIVEEIEIDDFPYRRLSKIAVHAALLMGFERIENHDWHLVAQ